MGLLIIFINKGVQAHRQKASRAAQTPRLNALFKAGWLVHVSVKHMHVLEEAADDTGLTVQLVAVSYEDVA